MADTNVDMIVIGAGFAGLRTLHTMRELGLKVVVLEAASDIGGVWYWNRYPGARCDVESYDYSYSFSEELEQEWRWSEYYATQPEILDYIEHVVDKFDLRRDIRLNERMTRAEFDESEQHWTVTTEAGHQWTAQFLIMASGQLSASKVPDIPGRENFAGEVYLTAEWPHEGVDFTGKRVGVIGTGSSGVQFTTTVAPEAEHLKVFQRTPNFVVPRTNAPISDEEDAAVKANYRERRERLFMSPTGLNFIPDKQSALDIEPEERQTRYETSWSNGLGFGFPLTFYDILLDMQANETAADFVREKITQKVEDPQVRETLTPHDHPFAGKRPPVDSGYYDTFNRDNVELIDIRANPIEEITPTGITTSAGEHELDAIVFATGFDAMTGPLLKPEIVGREGLTLREKWSAGPVTYLGLNTAGFPNMLVIAGPGSPSLLSNVLVSIEQHVDWLAGLLSNMQRDGSTVVEATPEAEQEWVEHVNARAQETIYPKASSYYMGDEVPGKPRVFMPYSGGVRGYRRICEQVADNGYEGFTFD